MAQILSLEKNDANKNWEIIRSPVKPKQLFTPHARTPKRPSRTRRQLFQSPEEPDVPDSGSIEEPTRMETGSSSAASSSMTPLSSKTSL